MPNVTFDYVIVGGGTAGLVLASRISENPNTTIAIIEAGANAEADPRVTVRVSSPPPSAQSSIGELSVDLLMSFQTTLNERRIGQTQGKLLGGSSSINAQALIPFSALDANSWEDFGNTGWNWTSMSPHLGEIFTISLPDGPTVEHLGIEWARNLPGANHGPVNASFADVKENPVGKSWIDTFEQLGFPLTGNPFCGNSTGAYNGVSTIDGATKTKSSSSSAYYKSLTEWTNTIVMEKAGGDPEAKGVHVIHNGSTSVIHAKKEVILASGVFNTPKLLELSGIGDPAILTKLGIDVNAANPNVGRNLQDHILCSISFEAEDGIPTGDELARGNATALQAAMDMYQKYHAGPLATSGITSFAYLPIFKLDQEPNAYGAILSDLATGSAEESPMDGARRAHLRDLIENGKEGTGQYFLFMAQADSAGKDTVGTFGSNPKPGNYISLAVALSHPLSTGTSHITSTDPNQPPTIDHRYLIHPVDLELHARQVRSLEVIAATEPFASLLKSKGRRNDPQSFIGGDLEKAKTYVRNMSTTNWHSCGTCAMGPRQKGGVVDESLRVHGVRGLRIVDASVIPFIPQSNLQSLVYTVAHKASDIIREDIT